MGLFGMLEALEEGLKGECENQSVDATLESAENYQNDFYISPNKLIGNVKSFMGNFPFIYKARGIKSSLKEFLVTFIHWELVNKPKEAKVSFDLKNSDTRFCEKRTRRTGRASAINRIHPYNKRPWGP